MAPKRFELLKTNTYICIRQISLSLFWEIKREESPGSIEHRTS